MYAKRNGVQTVPFLALYSISKGRRKLLATLPGRTVLLHAFRIAHIRCGMFSFEPAEHSHKHDNGDGAEDQLCDELRIREAVQREQPIQHKQRGDLQHDLAHNSEYERFHTHTARLEHAQREEIDAQEWQRKAEATQERRAVRDDALVLHEHGDNRLRRNHERQHHGQNKAKRNFRRKCKRLFHALDIAARVVITDQRHNALRKAHCNLERHHVDALRDAHGRHRVGAIRGRKVVENGHAGHIQKVLDGSRDAHAAHTLDNLFRWAEHGGLDTHVRLAALHEQQHEEVETRHGVGKAGRATRARRAEVQAPRQNENRVQHNVQQAAAHGADARVQRRALRAHKVRQHDVQNGRRGAEQHSPEQIIRRCLHRFGIRAEHHQDWRLQYAVQQRKQQAANQRRVKSERRAAVHGIVVFTSECAAHHAGAADAEQVVDGIKRQQKRCRQRNSGVLHRVVHHADKERIGKAVNDHHKRADDRRHRKRYDCLRDRHRFK